MPATILSDNGVVSGTSGLKTSGSNDGQLALQTTTAGGSIVTAVSINNSQVVTLAQPLPVASGGTGSSTGVNLATAATGTLPVGNGGTGQTSLTANNVILGNGGSAVQFVAPGSSGNILTSNGTTWTSAAAPAGGFSNLTVFTSSGTWSIPAGITKCKVIVTGAGGGAASSFSGAAGGTAIRVLTLTGSTATITVGAGGSGGSSSRGGTSSFVNDATTVSATGGEGGSSNANFGNTGGSGSGGDINISGGNGNADGGQMGAASFWGGGTNVTASAGAYGAGGGFRTATGVFNNGLPGIVVIEY